MTDSDELTRAMRGLAAQVHARDYVPAVYGRARRRRQARRRNAAAVAVSLAAVGAFATYRATEAAPPPAVNSTELPSQLDTPGPSLPPVPTTLTTATPTPTPHLTPTTDASTPPQSSFILPDGTRLAAGCDVPRLQATFPSANESFLAGDGCGWGQYSLSTGDVIRYVAAANRGVIMAESGDIYLAAPECGPARGPVQRLGTDSRNFKTLDFANGSNDSSALVLVPQTCDQRAESSGGWVYGNGGRQLAFGPGPSGFVPLAKSSAVDTAGRVAIVMSYVSYADCAAGQSGLCNKGLDEGLAVAEPTDSRVGPPTITPTVGCRFGSVAWSGKNVVVVERCDTGSGTTSTLVTIDPLTQARIATTGLPTSVDIGGIRALTNGDVLVAFYDTTTEGKLLRVSGSTVTPVSPRWCRGHCKRTARSLAP